MTPTWSRHGAADRVAKAASDGSRKRSASTGFFKRSASLLSKAGASASTAAPLLDAEASVLAPAEKKKNPRAR